MQQLRSQRLVACVALLAAPATAETVVLQNGYRLHAERLEHFPGEVRLLTPNGGWIAVQSDAVARIEPDESQLTESSPEDVAPPGAQAELHPQPGMSSLDQAIERIAGNAGLPSDLLRAVAWAESGFDPEAVSSKGAIGLMQLMPDTAAELGVDPRDPAENLAGGTRYLKQMLELFDGDSDQLVKALAAYNAGPGRVAEFRGIPPFRETNGYVGKVLRRYLNSSAADREQAPDAGVAASDGDRLSGGR